MCLYYWTNEEQTTKNAIPAAKANVKAIIRIVNTAPTMLFVVGGLA